jgi:hypothetical protein
MKKINSLIRYWKVGKLLHFVAFLAFFIALQSYLVLQNMNGEVSTSVWILWLMIFICFFNMAVLAELDGYSRYQNYKQIKDQIYLNGYQERLLKPLSKSSCQRAAVILAGDELGIKRIIEKYFYDRGYRWYHVIPDFVFKDPLLFFTVYFWRTTFFSPYYKPKIDFNNLVISET